MGRAAARVWQKGKQPTRGGQEEKGCEAAPRRSPHAWRQGFQILIKPMHNCKRQEKTNQN